MGRDSHSNASSGGGSSILTSFLPCMRPRRSRQSTPNPDVEAAKNSSKKQTQDATTDSGTRGPSFQSAGTPLELPNTPLTEDFGLQASVMKEFERVSEQPMKSQWQAEKKEPDNKPEQKHSRRSSLLQILDRRQSRSSNTIPPDNNVPKLPEQPSLEAAHKAPKPVAVEDTRVENPKQQPSTSPTDTLQEPTSQETTQPENHADAIAPEPKKSSEAVTKEQESELPPVASQQVLESDGPKKDIQKQDSPILQADAKDSVTKPEETKDTTST